VNGTASGVLGSSHKLLVAAKKKKKPKKVTVAHATITVQAGHSAPLKLKLNKKALAALKKAGKLKVTVVVKITSPGQTTVTKTFTITLKAPKKKKHH
jgi:hypothetical protein